MPHHNANDTATTMASAMLDQYAVDGSCSINDLIRRGFTAAEINKHGETARRRAYILSSPRVVSRSSGPALVRA